MTYDHTIKPTTINILGNSPRALTTRQSSYTPNTQEESTSKQSLWQRIKSGVKKVIGYADQALRYFKENIGPTIIAAASLLNAWTNYRRCTGKARDSVCYA